MPTGEICDVLMVFGALFRHVARRGGRCELAAGTKSMENCYQLLKSKSCVQYWITHRRFVAYFSFPFVRFRKLYVCKV